MDILKAIVLAAGSGTRIGKPKLFLKYHGEYFVDALIYKLEKANIRTCCCVIPPGLILSEYSFNKNINWVVNPAPGKGMISSIFYGIQFLKGSKGYLIVPVDHPGVRVSTLSLLKKTFESNNNRVIKPVYHSISGHPIIIPEKIASQIRQQPYEGGLRQILIDQKCKVKYIEVDDPGILQNVNTKKDLDNLS